ncbi:MAG: Mur ligase family protein [bacterium]
MSFPEFRDPDGAILTSIAESHLEFLKNTEGVAAEKKDIMAGMSPDSSLVVPRGPETFGSGPGKGKAARDSNRSLCFGGSKSKGRMDR